MLISPRAGVERTSERILARARAFARALARGWCMRL
jgi:hypothetical protein